MRALLLLAALAPALALGACAGSDAPGVYAPGVAGPGTGNLLTGHRLMEAGEYELALDAYLRAGVEDGLNVDTLAALGSANLRLGRLGQAERLLREAVALDASFPPAWNNLGVLLMERGAYGEASEVFRRAYAADSGGSDTIRDNLRRALARLEDPAYTGVNEAEEVRLIGFGRESPRSPEASIEPL